MKTLLSQRNLTIFSICVAIMGFATSGYFYVQYKRADTKLVDPTAESAKEVQALVAKISKHMVLPTGEEPTVATVTNTEKLKVQPFFANSVNGDKVLIYSQARKAILFRESTDRIIDVAPVNVGSQATASGQVKANESTRFALYNGTSIVGLTKKYELQLKQKVTGAVVIGREDAKKQNYQTSLLVDVSGTKQEEVLQIAQTLGLTVSTLPAGEATPAADFLIILGSDSK